MKKSTYTFLFAATFLLLFCVISFAQTKDTVNVTPGFNTLPDQIDLDIQNGADMNNRVYKLANEQPYLIDHTLEINFDLTLVSDRNGKPAQIQPVQDINSKSPTDLFHMYQDVYLENVALSDIDNVGLIKTRVFVLQKDSLSVTAERCVFELTGLNFFSTNALWSSFNFTNCVFNNIVRNNSIYNGRGFDDRGNVVKLFKAENTSFINVRSPLHIYGTYIEEFNLNHCTFYNSMTYVRGFAKALNVTFTNNILVNSCVYPTPFNPATNVDTVEGFQAPGVIDVDSMESDLATEAQKKWIVKNNNYWFTENIRDYYATLNDTLIMKPWLSSFDSAFAAKYPANYEIEQPLSVDPGFIMPPPSDSILAWADGYFNGERDGEKLADDIYAPGGLLDNNGVAILAYNHLDMSYTNTSPLYAAGTDGKPLGDLHWFKNLTDVETDEQVIPEDYSLFQNYPNPFNPSTNIKFSLPQAGNVQIIIYNSLGQMIGKLVDGFYPNGLHSIKFDGKNLSSGVYFYQLIANNIVMNRKMILIK